MFKIQTLNNISMTGLSHFDKKKYRITEKVDAPDAILLRSFNLHEMAIPPSVCLVGRAGAGTNNIPIEKMTQLGIPVMNTPGANANAVKELVITGMLLACRNICAAWDYARQLQGDDHSLKEQVEKSKKQFSGFELPGKTLGVIGLGNIGVKVANAARYLGMEVIGYDPEITVSNAWELRSSVQHAQSLDELLKRSDFVSIHVPLIDATKSLINEKRFKQMKKGAVLLNLARDGIVDNTALFDALEKDHIRSYVCDFPNKQFQQHPKVIALPHLGASTQEAEENCAEMIVKQAIDFLENGHINHSVNFPRVKMSRTEGYRLSVINRNVPNMVAQISSVLSKADLNIIDMINKSRSEIAYTLIDVNQPINDNVLNEMLTIDGVIRARAI